MASRQTTSKNAQKKGASRKAAPKQGAAKLRANAQAAPEPVPEPLFTGGTARDISGVVLAAFCRCVLHRGHRSHDRPGLRRPWPAFIT